MSFEALASGNVLEVRGLAKTYRKPFTRTKVEAVRGVSFTVTRGEIFGFLGPNGAGKTTTLKMLTGLVTPTAGSASLLGQKTPSPEAMARIGYLPENPYVYPYLTPREFVTLCARLNGMSGSLLAKRVERALERLGVAYAIDRPVRALSKGMLQRVGFAAALVHDPELLLLDEPMSGLDPVGRKEVRDIIVEERRAGRTVVFSSHILSDVELLCDRVCILRKGEVILEGKIADLLGADGGRVEIVLRGLGDPSREALAGKGIALRDLGRAWLADVEGEAAVRLVLSYALEGGAQVESVTPKRETLEDLFVRRAL